MICDGIAMIFGPEGHCYVEAIVTQSRNIPMISYVSTYCCEIKLSEELFVVVFKRNFISLNCNFFKYKHVMHN